MKDIGREGRLGWIREQWTWRIQHNCRVKALFERIEVTGLRRIRIRPSATAVAAGLAEAVLSASAGYGRGESV